jgi:hypothetical protein
VESDSATMTVQSNVTTPPAPPVIALSGQAIEEQRCYYSLTPASLSWGQVRPLQKGDAPYTQAFTITNLGPNECLVNGVNVLPGSDPVFSMTEIVSQRISPPGGGGPFPSQLIVPVSFSPEQTGSYIGLVGITISDPGAPNVQVTLSGTAGTSCFSVRPLDLSFGVLGLAEGGICSAEKGFVATNGCDQLVTISSALVTAGADVFSIDAGSLPITLDAGQAASVQVSFSPKEPGSYFGAVQLQTDLQQTPFGDFLSGTLSPGTSWTDRFPGVPAAIDILWVMDTADSSERQEVANHAADVIKGLQTDGFDFQIGVTSTDVCTGGMAEDGRILPCSGCHISGTPQIITQSDPTAATDLATLMGLGGASDDDCGSSDDEQLFQAAYEALVSGTGATDNLALGFVRPSAYLAVITVNGDGYDDASSYTQGPAWFADQFLSIKGSDHPWLFSWSYINPSGLGGTGGHQSFGSLPGSISSMLFAVGGVALDTTQTDWSKGLSDLWWIALSTNSVLSLSGVPDPTSLQVYLDGPPPDQVPDGGMAGARVEATNVTGSWNWRYDATRNALQLNPATVWLQSTDTLYVEYTLTCPDGGGALPSTR